MENEIYDPTQITTFVNYLNTLFNITIDDSFGSIEKIDVPVLDKKSNQLNYEGYLLTSKLSNERVIFVVESGFVA